MVRRLILIAALLTCVTAFAVDILWLDMTQPIELSGGTWRNVPTGGGDYTTDSILYSKYETDLDIQPDYSVLGTSTGVLATGAGRPTHTNGWGGTYYFDAGDEISYGDKPVFTFSDGVSDNEFSVNIWTWSSSFSATRALITKDSGGTDTFGEWYLYASSARIYFGTVSSNGVATRSIRTSTSVSTGEWVMVTAVYKPSLSPVTNAMELYTNGIWVPPIQVKDVVSYVAMSPKSNPVLVGNFNTFSKGWIGYLDNPRIYTNALTQARITEIYDFEKGLY